MIYDKTCGRIRLAVKDTPGEPSTAEVEVVTTEATPYGILTGLRLEDLRDLRYLIDRALGSKGAKG